MNKTYLAIEQIASPIRRHHRQRETLIGLGLNRIGRVVERLDTPEIRGMIAKVRHLVRVVRLATELDVLEAAVRATYQAVVTAGIVRGNVLWSQFEDTVTACRADPKGDDRAITERINELAVAKLLIDDPTVTGPITLVEAELMPIAKIINPSPATVAILTPIPKVPRQLAPQARRLPNHAERAEAFAQMHERREPQQAARNMQ